VARDRGGAYALAAARALPGATQVADRWHLMENASQAFLAATRASMRQIRAALGSSTVDPGLLTAAERLQYEGYLRREDANAAVLALHKAGVGIKEIVRRTGHSRGLVRRVVRGRVRRYSGPGSARLTRTFPGSMPDGTPESAMAQRSGGRCEVEASVARCAWSRNGRRGGGEPTL